MDWKTIIELIPEIVSAVSAIVAFVVLIINTIKNKNWKAIEEIALRVMGEVDAYAKAHPGMSSQEKLDMAIAGVKAAMDAAGIAFDETIIKKVIAFIEKMCKWSKGVNGK